MNRADSLASAPPKMLDVERELLRLAEAGKLTPKVARDLPFEQEKS